MARKRDVKQFRQACREAGLSARERYEASEALHAEKLSSGMKEHMGYEDLPGCENGKGANGERRSS